MRVAVWGINYSPELTGIAPYNRAMCDYLRGQGHQVEMVTTFAYYPAWKKLPEDRGRVYRIDVIDGIPVHRCWHYVPAKVSAMKRIVHEGSFVVTSFLRLLWITLIGGRRPDVLVVVSPPLLLGAAAWVFGLFVRVTGRRVPFVFHVQDLQPDAALGLGMLKPGMLTRVLYRLEALAYRAAARVSGISQGMLEAFASKGVPAEKHVYFPNPVVLPDLSKDLPARGGFRRGHGIGAEDFLAIYSGNLGVKQGLRVIVDAAEVLNAGDLRVDSPNKQSAVRDPQSPRSVRLVICGDGAERQALAQLVAEKGLSRVLTLLPLQARAEYEEMLVDADVCLITQQAGSGRAFFPSKLLTTLAFARPVVTVADPESELVRALDAGGFGVNVRPGQPEALARSLIELAGDGSAAVLSEMAQRGRTYVEQFAADRVFADFEKVIMKVATREAG